MKKQDNDPRLGDYNHRPEGWKEVDAKEYAQHYYFHYILDTPISRSLMYDENSFNSGLFSCTLYPLKYKGVNHLGCAIAWDWKAETMRYYIFGDEYDWKVFKGRFAAQFAGDNS